MDENLWNILKRKLEIIPLQANPQPMSFSFKSDAASTHLPAFSNRTILCLVIVSSLECFLPTNIKHFLDRVASSTFG